MRMTKRSWGWMQRLDEDQNESECIKSWCTTNCFILQANTQQCTYCSALHQKCEYWFSSLNTECWTIHSTLHCMLNCSFTPGPKNWTTLPQIALNSELHHLHFESRLFNALHQTLQFGWTQFHMETVLQCSDYFHAFVFALTWLQKLNWLNTWVLFSGRILVSFMPWCHVLQSRVQFEWQATQQGVPARPLDEKRPPREIARTWLSEKKTVHASII